jgi:hypothetical protein
MIALAATTALLSWHAAKAAILRVERYEYRPPLDAEVWLTDCRRHSPLEVACIAHTTITAPGQVKRYRVHVTATLRRGRIIVRQDEAIEYESVSRG